MTGAPDRAFWVRHYEEQPRGGHGHQHRPPRESLAAAVADLAPGRALDAGCGDGGDAVWLAQRGWRVTAVDVAPAAVERGRRRAAGLGPVVDGRIGWRVADLASWTPPEQAYDLVLAQHVHVPDGDRAGVAAALASAVAPGGLLLVVDHRSPYPSLTEPVARLTDGWTTTVDDGDHVVVRALRAP